MSDKSEVLFIRVSPELKARLVEKHGRNLSAVIRGLIEAAEESKLVLRLNTESEEIIEKGLRPGGFVPVEPAAKKLTPKEEVLAASPRVKLPDLDGIPKGNPKGTAQERWQHKNYLFFQARKAKGL